MHVSGYPHVETDRGGLAGPGESLGGTGPVSSIPGELCAPATHTPSQEKASLPRCGLNSTSSSTTQSENSDLLISENVRELNVGPYLAPESGKN